MKPMLRNLIVALAATAAMVVGGSAGAASMSAPAAIRTAADSLKMTENVQFFWSGHNYCWYDDGWNGPGWYWCDMYLQSWDWLGRRLWLASLARGTPPFVLPGSPRRSCRRSGHS